MCKGLDYWEIRVVYDVKDLCVDGVDDFLIGGRDDFVGYGGLYDDFGVCIYQLYVQYIVVKFKEGEMFEVEDVVIVLDQIYCDGDQVEIQCFV